jgi:hypothetical protein
MPYSLDRPDQLALVGREGAMARRDGAAEERHWVALLNEDSAEPMRRGVAFDHEDLGEVERTLMPSRGGVNRRDDQIKPFFPRNLSFTGQGG